MLPSMATAAGQENSISNRSFTSHHEDSSKISDNDDDDWKIPPLPSSTATRRKGRNRTSFTTPLQPLLGGGGRREKRQSYQKSPSSSEWPSSPGSSRGTRTNESANLLFGDVDLSISKRNKYSTNDNDILIEKNHRPSGIAGFFFGFMYEEPSTGDSFDYGCEDDEEQSSSSSSKAVIFSNLNLSLFAAYTLTTAAAAVPVVVMPTIGQDLELATLASTSAASMSGISGASAFSSRAAASAVMGTACGKILNGPVGDVFGARLTMVVYAFFLSMTLIRLTTCGDTECAVRVCFYIEFFYSVLWPCSIIVMATHYHNPHHKHARITTPSSTTTSIHSSTAMYEGGIYLTSIASRFGSLLSIPFYSTLLHNTHWRVVCLIGAWVAMIGSSVVYLFVTDSPHNVNEPQNKLSPNLLRQLGNVDNSFRANPRRFIYIIGMIVNSVLFDNLLPSLRHVLTSGVFWIVALAHVGSSLVRTSERILGTYFHDTSMGTLSETQAGGFTVYLSLGTIMGLLIAGGMFTRLSRREEMRQRKYLVSRLYMVTIASCYGLTILAIPKLRYVVDSPGLILFFQVLSAFGMGFGIAVMFYHIPGLVSVTAFDRDKGLFASFTDGVAYGIASMVWRLVGNAVERGDATTGGGWAYGWAAVALIIVLCSVLMVEFMEHYFVRAVSGMRHSGAYETIIIA